MRAAKLPEYNEGIADRATLETEPRTIDERRSWLAARDAPSGRRC